MFNCRRFLSNPSLSQGGALRPLREYPLLSPTTRHLVLCIFAFPEPIVCGICRCIAFNRSSYVCLHSHAWVMTVFDEIESHTWGQRRHLEQK